MIRSFAFTTQGRLHTENIDLFLMPTLLADTNLFLWVDLEAPTEEEVRTILTNVFHFHPLSIEDCVTVSPSPKVEEYSPGRVTCFLPTCSWSCTRWTTAGKTGGSPPAS
jgi:magnesium transporter